MYIYRFGRLAKSDWFDFKAAIIVVIRRLMRAKVTNYVTNQRYLYGLFSGVLKKANVRFQIPIKLVF